MKQDSISFFGKDLSRGACETLALQRVDPEIRANEADLYSTKWFDYRVEHWVHSTYRYAHEYKAAVRAFCRINTDVVRAETLTIFSAEDIFHCRDLTACINARQALDRIGCRYDWALTWMLKRFSDRGWLALPRPNQLYSEELLMDIRDAWVEECAAALQVARDEHFQLPQEGPLQPVQREYTDWSMAQAQERGIDAWRTLSRLLMEGVITPDILAGRFPPSEIDRALRVAGLIR